MKRWIENLLKKSVEPVHLKAGRWGEQQAIRFLKKNGYKVLGQRVRVGKRDELDIVAEHDGVLVFVEVKTRKNENYGRPFSAVDKAKCKHLSRAAVAYLKQKKIKPEFIRFDVVEVIGEPGGGAPEIRHIENAFPLDSAYRLWW
ncbi:MAG: YraN family protein [Kiritimatiellales bacterium]|nr:YraN family protein [Kiritimatiellales bacterium]